MLNFQQHPPPFVAGQERKDSRVTFNGHKHIIAHCGTRNGYFIAPLRDLSTSGAFVLTDQTPSIGEEITLDFLLPNQEKSTKITGEVVRKTDEGVGIEFRIIFKY